MDLGLAWLLCTAPGVEIVLFRVTWAFVPGGGVSYQIIWLAQIPLLGNFGAPVVRVTERREACSVQFSRTTQHDPTRETRAFTPLAVMVSVGASQTVQVLTVPACGTRENGHPFISADLGHQMWMPVAALVAALTVTGAVRRHNRPYSPKPTRRPTLTVCPVPKPYSRPRCVPVTGHASPVPSDGRSPAD